MAGAPVNGLDWLGEWREGLQLTNEIKCLESLRPCLSLSLALGKKYKVIYLNRKDLHYLRNETN